MSQISILEQRVLEALRNWRNICFYDRNPNAPTITKTNAIECELRDAYDAMIEHIAGVSR